MTGGGLMQLVAYGAQDVYLTGNPQITFFKVVYRRHTNFAMESIENPFNGAPNCGKTVTCTIQSDIDTRATFLLVGTDGSEFVVGRQEGLRAGSQSIELPLTGLAAGAYQLVVRQGTMQVSAPLMITR